VDDVLLIAADWQFRRLVYAQLLEEGYAVLSLPSLEVALAHLLRGGEAARATVLDLEGLEPPATAGQVGDLRGLTGRAPLILCGGRLHGRVLDEAAAAKAAAVLRRPFSVGEVVDAVGRVLRPERESTQT
jgi:DNA-binding response OmpR family regulator